MECTVQLCGTFFSIIPSTFIIDAKERKGAMMIERVRSESEKKLFSLKRYANSECRAMCCVGEWESERRCRRKHKWMVNREYRATKTHTKRARTEEKKEEEEERMRRERKEKKRKARAGERWIESSFFSLYSFAVVSMHTVSMIELEHASNNCNSPLTESRTIRKVWE